MHAGDGMEPHSGGVRDQTSPLALAYSSLLGADAVYSVQEMGHCWEEVKYVQG